MASYNEYIFPAFSPSRFPRFDHVFNYRLHRRCYCFDLDAVIRTILCPLEWCKSSSLELSLSGVPQPPREKGKTHIRSLHHREMISPDDLDVYPWEQLIPSIGVKVLPSIQHPISTLVRLHAIQFWPILGFHFLTHARPKSFPRPDGYAVRRHTVRNRV